MADYPSKITRPSAGFSVTAKLKIQNLPGTFLRISQEIANRNASMRDVKLLYGDVNYLIREVTINCLSEEQSREVVESLGILEGIQLLEWRDDTFEIHKGGKLEMQSRMTIKNTDDLSRAYTPGVARVCTAIEEEKEKAYEYTVKGNTVAVVTDGSAVLGLGNIGPEAALPVMEGKCVLFKQFGGIDSYPICLLYKC